MVCNKCGALCQDNTMFCTSCGNRLAAQQQPQQSQQQSNQPVYQQPQNNYYQQPPVMNGGQPMQYQTQKTEPVTSIGKYLLWWLIGLIPLIGFILTIVFAVDKSDMNRANFFRAQLIIMAIGVLLGILSVFLVLSAGVGILNEFYDVFDAIEYLV
ncbi:MAG: zinc ribbon domain-containing protein [Clostridia bacterium]|nr:zinc ribbon domain-containing protein [Clostridia bacterium]